MEFLQLPFAGTAYRIFYELKFANSLNLCRHITF
jgi:hypothetical protein